ncbi:MAG TPA: galactokinase, partial [Spirochaetota bacterium]|nr:galactokinase [Spirochaetota bacterium]
MEKFLYEEFKRIFNYYPKEYGLYFAPGRINLIGEHTDYTGGTVLPASINCGTYILATKNNSSDIRINSLNFENEITVIKFDAPLVKTSNWSDYFKGCIKELDNVRSKENGFDALIFGNIPNGSGLSSSASFEMASLITILDMNNLPIPKNGSKEMVDLTINAKNCENNFVGVNCGIMDQFAIGNGKKDMCARLDCYDLSFEYSPLNLGKYRVLVANTNKKRRLEESKYNERRQECEKGFEIFKKYKKNKEALGRVTIEEWSEVKEKFNDNTIIKKRLNHVISENNR